MKLGVGLLMTKVARNIELYNLAYRLAWKYVSNFQNIADPDIASAAFTTLSDAQLKQGSVEPVLIAAEALQNIDKPNGQTDNNE